MKMRTLLVGALLGAGCGTTEAEPPSARSEVSLLGELQSRLSERLELKFGQGARVQQVFGRGPEVLLGVTLEAPVADSDVRRRVALATFRRDTDSLELVAERAEYKEARQLRAGLALVTADGELRLRGADGREQTLATDVKGEVSDAPGQRLVATLEGGSRPKGDSAIFVADASGQLTVLADAEGVDDRPSVSPDEKTVVFVSGRTGVASLWLTTLDGAEPVQLTNRGLESGVAREGPPEGFVPPPVMADGLEWVSKDVVRYDAGDGELWTVNVRTGEARREGGAP
jgi:hypothetical protein